MAGGWNRTSAASRGYGSGWRTLRERILKRDGYVCRCRTCTASGRVLLATEVDHIVSKAEWRRRHGSLDGVDDPSNLQAINDECHKVKTMVENGAQPRSGCDVTGWPTDPMHPWNRP